jgi:hypothetical protein
MAGDVRLGLGEHDLVVGIGFHASEFLGFGRQSLGVGVRDGDDAGGWYLQPDGVLAVSVVTWPVCPMTPTVSGRSAPWARSNAADKAKAEAVRKSRRCMLFGRSRIPEEVELAVFGAAEEVRDAIGVEIHVVGLTS